MTKIEWTDKSWNPIVGCSIVSSGCTNCYAMKQAHRLLDKPGSHYHGTTKKVNGSAVWTGKVAMAPGHIVGAPLKVKKPTMWFVNSMGDLFHEDVPFGWVMLCINIMAKTPHHTYQILTKRPDRMREFFRLWSDLDGEDFEDFKDARGPEAVRSAHPSGRGQLFADYLDAMLEAEGGTVPDGAAWPTFDWMNGQMRWPSIFFNIWLGTSAERQKEFDERASDLVEIERFTKFISAEPLLGPIDMTPHLNRLDWVIAGGESGKGSRPMHPDWARSLRDQCQEAGVAFHFKQWGNWSTVYDRDKDDPDWRRCPQASSNNERYLNIEGGHGFHNERVVFVRNVGKRAAGRLLDGRTWDEFPGLTRRTPE